MRRKRGALLPLEASICAAAMALRREGETEFHGFAIAKHLQESAGARRLTAHGTLYKALARLRDAGMLESRWEAPEFAAEQQRPARRLYRLTSFGVEVLARHERGDETPLLTAGTDDGPETLLPRTVPASS